MFGSAIIVFRETLEAALLIGIIAASTRGLDYRNRWLGIGIAAGMIGSLIVAWLTESIADMFEGNGQEIFKAAVLGIAVVMIGWHNIWMASHGKEMAARAKNVGNAIRSGQQELSAIAIAIALTVLREGSEAALFLQGMLASTTDGAGSVVMGGLLGMIAGASIGMITYFGLLRIPLSRFFSVTGTLLLLLAAGLASQMAKFLIQADLLPSLASPLWDTSWILPVTSSLGSALAILLGYEDKPTGMQAIFYFATLACIYIGASWTHRNATPSSQKLKSA
ncbi:FTR1 family protein [Noviherbaspirillum sp.]|uniref:FTR1 family iron permease n=1 Tax=Noviherbaspirillum sp. TaxID=1926288 RepID=UPI0025EEDFA9|nr:FTR1 family protein [Noviherbaspirillum sp.]